MLSTKHTDQRGYSNSAHPLNVNGGGGADPSSDMVFSLIPNNSDLISSSQMQGWVQKKQIKVGQARPGRKASLTKAMLPAPQVRSTNLTRKP